MKTIFICFFFLTSSIILEAQTPDSWSQKANSGGTPKSQATTFVVNGKAYYVTGYQFTNELWEYNPALNTWAQKANYPGPALIGAVSFSIGENGYVLLGNDAGFNGYTAVWEYNPKTNAWNQKKYFPGNVTQSEYGFSIGNFGYVVIFSSGKNETWKYNPAGDTWVQKANFPGVYRNEGALALSIGEKGYLGFGVVNNTTYLNDFWEYDTLTNNWTQKANYGGANVANPCGFAIGSKAYIGTGRTGTTSSSYKTDFYEYRPSSNTWIQVANYPLATIQASGFSIGNKGYVVGGFLSSASTDALWEYTPPTSAIEITGSKNKITIYPNPFTDAISICNLPSDAINQICIYDMTGKMIFSQSCSETKNTFELPQSLNAGFYFIKIIQDNKTNYCQKIIKL